MNLMTTQERLKLDAGLSLDDRIAKLKKTNKTTKMKRLQLCKYFKK
jgi:hypothetical protein